MYGIYSDVIPHRFVHWYPVSIRSVLRIGWDYLGRREETDRISLSVTQKRSARNWAYSLFI